MITNRRQAKLAYIRMVKERFPQVWDNALNQLSDDAPASTSPDWIDKTFSILEKTIPIYAGIQQQKTYLKINAERAKQGLPPLDANAFAPQANIGVAKDVQWIMWAGVAMVGIVAYFMFANKKR